MNSSSSIAQTLKRILSLSLPPLVGACGGIGADGFELTMCREGAPPQYLAKVKPKDLTDYAELREFARNSSGAARAVDSIGEKCKKATNKAACEAKIAGATSTQGFRLGECIQLCSSYFLVVNTGDDVTIVDTKEGAKAWLGPVDTPQEAVLTTLLEGYSVSCSEPERGGVRPAGEAYEVLATKYTSICAPVTKEQYVLRVDKSGNVQEVESDVIESSSACIGRRPAGLAPTAGRGRTRVGAYFANVAQLEAASVHAFEALEQELDHHGAPRSLVERAKAAERDERRHARVMRRLSARYGGRFSAPRVERKRVRSLEEIAIENATEGCVRETFGALVGMWQAEFARDPVVRRSMKKIAQDETRHAELSWAIDAWIKPRLSPKARQRVEKAREEALRGIKEEAQRGYDRTLVDLVGMPDEEASARLARHFAEALAATS